MATKNAINSNIPIEISKGGTNATSMATSYGVTYFDGTRLVTVAGVGTADQVLTSNGAGVAPSFKDGGGVSGTTNHAVQVGNAGGTLTSLAVGTTGQVLLGATGADPGWTSSPNIAGTVTAGTGLTVTTGDATLSSGNLKLPATSSTVGQIKFNNVTKFHTYGTRNIFLGGAGNYTLTGTDNIGIGDAALEDKTTVGNTIAIGTNAGASYTTGSAIVIGHDANKTTTTATVNLSLGNYALDNLGNGSYNIAIGYEAGTNYSGTESSNLLIGNSGTSGDSNTIRIGTYGTGDGEQDKCYIAAIRGITTGAADAIDVLIDSNGQLGTVSSSARFKKDIVDVGERSEAIYSLRPVSFVFKDQDSDVRQYGLIAEEVDKVLPELVVKDKDGECETVKYREIPTLILNELIKLRKKVKELKSLLAESSGR